MQTNWTTVLAGDTETITARNPSIWLVAEQPTQHSPCVNESGRPEPQHVYAASMASLKRGVPRGQKFTWPTVLLASLRAKRRELLALSEKITASGANVNLTREELSELRSCWRSIKELDDRIELIRRLRAQGANGTASSSLPR